MRRGRAQAAALAALGLIALTTACGRPPGAERSAPPSTPVVEEATADGKPRIELLALGATPREPLRLTPAAGNRTDADVTTSVRARLDSGHETRMEMSYGWTGSVVQAGPDARVVGELDRMEIDGEPSEPLALAFSYAISTSGWIREFSIAKPEPTPIESALGQSTQQALSFLAVFPAAPIGVGARWRLTVEMMQNGTPVTMTVTSELVGRAGPRARIRADLTFRSPAQLPIAVEGTGALELLVDIRQVIPTTRLTMTYLGHIAGDSPDTLRGDATMTLTPRR